MYFYSQILALGVQLPLIDFVRQVLAFYNVTLTQLKLGIWLTILGYEAFCIDFSASLYRLEDFATVYTMRKIPSVRFFSPQGSWPKLIVNLPDSDHG